MNKKQSNNIIAQTIKHEQMAQSENSLQTARAIFKNMGVALPQGEIGQVYEVLKTDDYMGWKSCSAKEAKEAADRGTAAIGISAERIVVLSAANEEEPVAETTDCVMTLSESTSAYTVSGLSFFAYSYGSTTTVNPYILVNGWLKLYSKPTVACGGRTVNIPTVAAFTGSDGYRYQFTNRNYWWTFEGLNDITSAAKKQLVSLGQSTVVNRGIHGELTDINGRYWMAVGPNVVNPNHTGSQMPTPSEMYGKGVLDIVIKNSAGTKYYIPAIVGDTKAHTWNNGVIQTWKTYTNGAFTSCGANYNGTVAAEFMGSSSGSGLNSYSIDSIIFYPY